MGAMVPDEVVRLAHHPCRSDGDRLLADAAVGGPEDDALLEELGCAFLEHPDQDHPPVLLDRSGRSGGLPTSSGVSAFDIGGRWWNSKTYPSGSSE